jgi:hypothetical protein
MQIQNKEKTMIGTASGNHGMRVSAPGLWDIPDGMWAAEGEILLPSDRPLTAAVNARNEADETYVISVSNDVSRVTRMITATSAAYVPDVGWVTKAKCVWVGDEPFAVSVLRTIRDAGERDARTMLRLKHFMWWSQQHHKDGEFKLDIEIDRLPSVEVLRTGEGTMRWVRLDMLAEKSGLFPVNLVKRFLFLAALGDARQRNFVWAEDEHVLSDGALDRSLDHSARNEDRVDSFLSRGGTVVPATQVWASLPAAVGVMRLMKLGVSSGHSLFPTRMV